MKLVIAGATGFVATEVLRQGLRMHEITSIVALARKPVSAPEGTDSSKLKSVVVQDYGTYSEDVKKELAGADACIWTVAITPFKARSIPFDEVRLVCQDWTLAGFRTMLDAGPNKSFRFLYMSGAASGDKAPKYMAQYALMRGETEEKVLALASEHKEQVEACVAKPGFILGQSGILRSMLGTAINWTGIVDTINVKEVAAGMLNQVVHGFETEPLTNSDMIRISKKVLDSDGKR